MEGRKPKVLLVNGRSIDGTMEQKLIAAIGEAGFEVVVAGEARTALVCLSKAAIDVVVCDTVVEGMGGFELIRKGLLLRSHSTPSFILYSSDLSLDCLLSAIRLGVDEYVSSPAMPGELVHAINRSMARRRAKPPPLPPRAVAAAKLLMAAHDQRQARFADWDIDQTSWQMLIELYLAQRAARSMTVKDACLTSLTNFTSASRRLSRLTSKGLVIRQPDRADRRRTFLKLSPSTYNIIDEYFSWLGLRLRSADDDYSSSKLSASSELEDMNGDGDA